MENTEAGMDFKEMTLLQLKAYAKEKGIRGISTLKKEQLVEKLMKSEKYEEKREEKKEENIEVKREDIDNDLLLKKEKEEKLQQRFIECLNSFNINAISECIKYLDELPFEVIDYVLSKTSGIKCPNWNYANTILQDYVKRKIDSVEKIQAEESGVTNKRQYDLFTTRQSANSPFDLGYTKCTNCDFYSRLEQNKSRISFW